MAIQKIKFGAGELVLTKSTKYVGVKKAETRSLMGPSLLEPEVQKVVHPNLGGFQLVTVKKKKGEKVGQKLDLMRSLDEVEVGPHVYHAPGSDKPLIPTGTLYITFANK